MCETEKANSSVHPPNHEKGTMDPLIYQPTVEKDIEAKNQNAPLERSLGFFSSVGVIIGCIIGSGIFISPAGVLQNAGSFALSLIVWVAAGIFVTFGSFVYIELGLLLSLSGGDYSYIYEAFGNFAGFMRLWVEAIIVRPCTATIVALTFSQYILVALLGGSVNDYQTLYLSVAACMLIFQTFINCVSVKASVWVNNICTIAKVLALGVVIGIGAYALIVGTPGAYDNFTDPFANSDYSPGSIAIAFYSALFAYQGWNYLNFIIEEVKDPEVVLPRAVLVSVFTVIAIYVLCNIAFFTALSPTELLSSGAAAIDFAIKITGWKACGIIVSLFVAISCFGSGNGVIFTSSRLFLVGARNGHMPRFLVMTNPRLKTPIPSVLATGFLALCYLALSDNAVKLINYIAVSYWAAIGLATISLIYFRCTRKTDPTYKVKYPIIVAIVFLLGCVFLVCFPFLSNFRQTMIGVGIVCTGLPFYPLVYFRPKCCERLSDCVFKFFKHVFKVEDEERMNMEDHVDGDENVVSIPLVPPVPVESDLKHP
ncbi:hypothetical protein FO519_003616 [Halicephalobus sp. NKZ332]|nr:hypothetical protein FO519_003616 [Halicephalobus sp. NKZ332]